MTRVILISDPLDDPRFFDFATEVIRKGFNDPLITVNFADPTRDYFDAVDIDINLSSGNTLAGQVKSSNFNNKYPANINVHLAYENELGNKTGFAEYVINQTIDVFVFIWPYSRYGLIVRKKAMVDTWLRHFTKWEKRYGKTMRGKFIAIPIPEFRKALGTGFAWVDLN